MDPTHTSEPVIFHVREIEKMPAGSSMGYHTADYAEPRDDCQLFEMSKKPIDTGKITRTAATTIKASSHPREEVLMSLRAIILVVVMDKTRKMLMVTPAMMEPALLSSFGGGNCFNGRPLVGSASTRPIWNNMALTIQKSSSVAGGRP